MERPVDLRIFSLLYAAVLTTSSSLIQNNIKPLPTTTKNEEPNSQLSTHSNWKRTTRLFSLLSIIPGGIGIDVGAGLSTAYLHSLQSRSPNQPSSSCTGISGGGQQCGGIAPASATTKLTI
ncbi:uncharacterized protein PGTG_20312 [Puccinia graminis f. sp. tritici CRL 75-36-700-3]|uniref:Uncharacterized protein n=1 Tax=Puccinia graminis f. sp. tritici (strain CRL 75-36-700-3 / race SCCL) TaxID=418459 RepID=E3NXQ7_PUCGT|nr:uncharacterized protein PGTG_20312 [Puccinia graminis f. sp. tritici CRL 75-36-700-3]EFP94356.2 hypothetical protein PGTG_20312 [Puccinia graminis f. sp. tritici CRL 75-36-700-3]